MQEREAQETGAEEDGVMVSYRIGSCLEEAFCEGLGRRWRFPRLGEGKDYAGRARCDTDRMSSTRDVAGGGLGRLWRSLMVLAHWGIRNAASSGRGEVELWTP